VWQEILGEGAHLYFPSVTLVQDVVYQKLLQFGIFHGVKGAFLRHIVYKDDVYTFNNFQ